MLGASKVLEAQAWSAEGSRLDACLVPGGLWLARCQRRYESLPVGRLKEKLNLSDLNSQDALAHAEGIVSKVEKTYGILCF